jgi:hypothetical protein
MYWSALAQPKLGSANSFQIPQLYNKIWVGTNAEMNEEEKRKENSD